MDKKKSILKRVYFGFLVLFLFGAAVVFQIVKIQWFESKEIVKSVAQTSAGYRPVTADRGDIYATDGSLLATSLTYYNVGMDLSSKALTDENFNKYLSALCDSLATLSSKKMITKTAKQYRAELVKARKKKKSWYQISPDLSYPEFKRLKEFPLFKLGRYSSGLAYTKDVKREKPFGIMAARTIGNSAPFGMEGAFHQYLRGKDGEQYQRKIPGGLWVPVNDRNSIDPIDGYDVYSTIDIGIQEIVNNALTEQLIKHKAEYGCIVVMETKTGKVRAISNLKVDSLGNSWEDINYAVGNAEEPGSTFKLASIMALLEDKKVDLDTKIEVGNGSMSFNGIKMQDSHLYDGLRVMTVKEIFQESSNVGIAKLVVNAYRNEPQKYIDRLFSFRLHDKLGLDIQGEPFPIIKDPTKKDWSSIALPWTSIGYGVALTPMQILAFYNAIANNGTLIKPIFAEQIKNKQEVIEEFGPQIIKKAICSNETLIKLQAILKGVVTEGTAKNGFKGAPYTVAGKTGTAVLNYAGLKEGGRKQYRASFVGYFPAEDPFYTCIVVITNPRDKGFYGSEIAVPAFRKISDRLYSTSKLLRRHLQKVNVQDQIAIKNAPKEELIVVAKKLKLPLYDGAKNTENDIVSASYANKKVKIDGTLAKQVGVPNVKNLSIKEALHILENLGLKVVVKGFGKVIKQSILPGMKVVKGRTIELILA